MIIFVLNYKSLSFNVRISEAKLIHSQVHTHHSGIHHAIRLKGLNMAMTDLDRTSMKELN